MMTQLMQKLFLSCFNSTELMEKRHHFDLSVPEKLQLVMHKSMCDACTRYERQSAILEKSIQSYLIKSRYPKNTDNLKIEITEKINNLD